MAEELDAQEIISRLGQKYSRFGSYQDCGYVESILAPGTPSEIQSRLFFNTLFRRPNFFRFEWIEPGTRKTPPRTSIIWCDGKKTYKKYAFRKTISSKNLAATIAGATGFSRGVSGAVPALLMQEAIGRKLTDQKALIYVGTESLGGEDCFHLRQEDEHDLDLWISTSRYVVLKIFEQFMVGEGENAAEWVSNQAFKSLKGFIRWLKLRPYLAGQQIKEPFHVIERTCYTKIIIDRQLPDHAFTMEGLT